MSFGLRTWRPEMVFVRPFHSRRPPSMLLKAARRERGVCWWWGRMTTSRSIHPWETIGLLALYGRCPMAGNMATWTRVLDTLNRHKPPSTSSRSSHSQQCLLMICMALKSAPRCPKSLNLAALGQLRKNNNINRQEGSTVIKRRASSECHRQRHRLGTLQCFGAARQNGPPAECLAQQPAG